MERGGTISLLPESRRKLEINVPGENRPIYYGLGVVVFVLILFVGVKLYVSQLTNKMIEIQNEVDLVEKQRDKKFEQQLIQLNKQFPLIAKLLKSHLIWSNALITFQHLVPPQTQTETILGDITEAKMEIKGRAPNYTTIAKQIAALLSDKSVVDVALDKVSTFSTGTLEYNMRVRFNKENLLLNK